MIILNRPLSWVLHYVGYRLRWSVWYLEYQPRLRLGWYSRYQTSTSDDILYFLTWSPNQTNGSERGHVKNFFLQNERKQGEKQKASVFWKSAQLYINAKLLSGNRTQTAATFPKLNILNQDVLKLIKLHFTEEPEWKCSAQKEKKRNLVQAWPSFDSQISLSSESFLS